MKMRTIMTTTLLATLLTLTAGCRHVRTAQDVTPGNPRGEKLDWRYGAGDIKIQTAKINKQLMDRWFATTKYDGKLGKPRIIITAVDNRTDSYISTDMIRDIIEGVAIDDGRYTITVGDVRDEAELDRQMDKIINDPKYSNTTRLVPGMAKAPQFLGKIRITKAVNSDNYNDYEDYRMSVTLYDIETQVAVDSAWDVLTKKVRR